MIITRRPLEAEDSYVVIVQRVPDPVPSTEAPAQPTAATADGPTPEGTPQPLAAPTYKYHLLVYREMVIGDVTKNVAVGPSEIVMKELLRQAPLLPMDENIHFFYCALVQMVPTANGGPVTPVKSPEPSAADGPTPEKLH